MDNIFCKNYPMWFHWKGVGKARDWSTIISAPISWRQMFQSSVNTQHLRYLTNWPSVLTFYKKQLVTNQTSDLVIQLIFWSLNHFQLSLKTKLRFVVNCIFLHFLNQYCLLEELKCVVSMYLNVYLLFYFTSNSYTLSIS